MAGRKSKKPSGQARNRPGKVRHRLSAATVEVEQTGGAAHVSGRSPRHPVGRVGGNQRRGTRPGRLLGRCVEVLLVFLVFGTFGVAIWHEASRERPAPASGGEIAEPEHRLPEMVPGVVEPPAIVIDAGHGGVDGGTVGHGLIEKNQALAIARKVRDELERRGRRVLMTREDDTTLGLKSRSTFANRKAGRLMVSVHLNAGPASVSGIETFYSEPKALTTAAALRMAFPVPPGTELRDRRHILLAERVQAAVCAATGARDRGTKNRPELSVTRHTECPAVLVECGFVSHPGEAARIATTSYQRKLAVGIADGIEAYLEDADADPWFGIIRGDAPEGETVEVVARSRSIR